VEGAVLHDGSGSVTVMVAIRDGNGHPDRAYLCACGVGKGPAGVPGLAQAIACGPLWFWMRRWWRGDCRAGVWAAERLNGPVPHALILVAPARFRALPGATAMSGRPLRGGWGPRQWWWHPGRRAGWLPWRPRIAEPDCRWGRERCRAGAGGV